MIKVYIKKQSNYPVKAIDLKKKLSEFFKKKGIVSDAFVSVALIGEEKMLDLGKKYLKDNKQSLFLRNKVHNVLSFSPDEIKEKDRGRFVYPPGLEIDLGEIIVCYPKAVEDAKREGKRIDAKVMELIEHGAKHLMGIHH